MFDLEFVEFTEASDDKYPVLVNPKDVSFVCCDKQHREILMKNGRGVWVKETFEEIKKRLGMSITPRAETLAKVG